MRILKSSSIVAILIALPVSYLSSQELSKDTDLIWKWTTYDHASHLIETIFELDSNIIDYVVIPVCHHSRSSPCPESGANDHEFNFNLKPIPKRAFRGVTRGRIEGSIWNAGGDPDQITFGIGMCKNNRIALNYMYNVSFNTTQTEQIAPGFKVTTKWFKK